MNNKIARQLMFRTTPLLWVDTCIQRRLVQVLRQNKKIKYASSDVSILNDTLEHEIQKWVCR